MPQPPHLNPTGSSEYSPCIGTPIPDSPPLITYVNFNSADKDIGYGLETLLNSPLYKRTVMLIPQDYYFCFVQNNHALKKYDATVGPSGHTRHILVKGTHKTYIQTAESFLDSYMEDYDFIIVYNFNGCPHQDLLKEKLSEVTKYIHFVGPASDYKKREPEPFSYERFAPWKSDLDCGDTVRLFHPTSNATITVVHHNPTPGTPLHYSPIWSATSNRDDLSQDLDTFTPIQLAALWHYGKFRAS